MFSLRKRFRPRGRQSFHRERPRLRLEVLEDRTTPAVDVLVNNNTGSIGTQWFTQSETTLLAFGSTVVVGFNDSGSNNGASKFTGFSRSIDGGATFTDGGTLPTNSGGDAGDPILARNATTGRIFFGTLGFNVATIQVFHSDDNGATWSAPVNGTPGGGDEDKDWMAIDNFSGAGNGNVYLVARDFGLPNGIYLYRSTDNGATFGPSGGTLIVSGNQGAYVAVGPDHSVYAFWYAGTTIQMRKSTDLGVSFGPAVTVASGLVGGVNGDLGLTGVRQGTSTPAGFRSNQFPHAALNPVSGNIYVTYDNDGAGVDKADAFMVQSADGGTTWGAPTKINDDATTTDQWFPTPAVSPDGTKLGIFYYSRQEDTASNNLFKYYGRIGDISGSTVTFGASFAISDVASLPEFGRDAVVNSVYMGDYNQAVATNTAFHVVWSDNRDDLAGGAPRKDPNVYYDTIPFAAPAPTISITDVSLAEGNAGTTPFTFTVSLSSPATGTVTVDVATTDGTATAPSDYTAVPTTTLTFTTGQSSQNVTVFVNGDTTVEPNETFFVNLSNASGATIADGQGQGTIQNDDAAPQPSLSINDVSQAEGNNGGTNFVFTVTLSAASGQTVTVQFATADGTASSANGKGKDYTSKSGTLTFDPGVLSQTISVSVKGDRNVEANETFFVNLSNANGATLADSQGLGSIVNDDGAGPGGGSPLGESKLSVDGLAIWLPDEPASLLPARNTPAAVSPVSLRVTDSGDWNIAFAVSQKLDAVQSSQSSSDSTGADWWTFLLPLEMPFRDAWC
jgi:hypothetical protein